MKALWGDPGTAGQPGNHAWGRAVRRAAARSVPPSPDTRGPRACALRVRLGGPGVTSRTALCRPPTQSCVGRARCRAPAHKQAGSARARRRTSHGPSVRGLARLEVHHGGGESLERREHERVLSSEGAGQGRAARSRGRRSQEPVAACGALPRVRRLHGRAACPWSVQGITTCVALALKLSACVGHDARARGRTGPGSRRRTTLNQSPSSVEGKPATRGGQRERLGARFGLTEPEPALQGVQTPGLAHSGVALPRRPRARLTRRELADLRPLAAQHGQRLLGVLAALGARARGRAGEGRGWAAVTARHRGQSAAAAAAPPQPRPTCIPLSS